MLYALSVLGLPAHFMRRRTAGGESAILMYHGTSHAGPLERQLRLIARGFEVVALADLAEQRVTRRPRVALTFDDGLRNNFTVAYPLLRRLGLPATFFVCPGLIGTGTWLWNHEARQRLLSLSPDELGAMATELGAPADPDTFVQWMKSLRLPARRRIEDLVRDATPRFRPSSEQHAGFDLADWHELRALDPRIATIGSHTMTHPVLTSLDPATAEYEIGESRRTIERELGREAAYFCYPNGDHDDVAVAAAKRHYRAAVTTATGSVPAACDPHRLPRLPAPVPRLGALLRLARRLYA